MSDDPTASDPELEDQAQMWAESSNPQADMSEDDESETELATAQRERDEFLDALRRERAEFENFRRRSAKERTDAQDRGAEQVVVRLLGVLDSFVLALDATAKSGDEQLHKGVDMVYAQLMEAMTGMGLTEVEGKHAPFDPTIHEAMLQVDAIDDLGYEVPEPVVTEVLRPGYRFKGRVLRPAAVKVAR